MFISPKSIQSDISFWLFETDCTFSWEGKGCISHFQHFPSFRVCGYKDLSFTTENTKVAHLYLVCSSSLCKHWKTLQHGQTHDRTCRSFLSRLLCRGGLCHGASKLNTELAETPGSPHSIPNPQGQGDIPLHRHGDKA